MGDLGPEGHYSALIERLVAAGIIILLTLINLAGVKWVVRYIPVTYVLTDIRNPFSFGLFSFRLQFALLVVLVAGAVDFGFGSFTHTDPENGFYGWNLTVWRNNSRPSYTGQHDFFSVFGVFFPGRDSFES